MSLHEIGNVSWSCLVLIHPLSSMLAWSRVRETSSYGTTYLEQHVTSATAHQDTDYTVLHPLLTRIFAVWLASD
ncbi:hypothetical protein EV401DRAFT_372789 [Pisolithus croceorrhizus]|nr:hypothetical protein EV401DRAFT_372789 [Pisolithus croceorrhizus]